MSVRTTFLIIGLGVALVTSAESAIGAQPGAVSQTGNGAVPQSIKPPPLQLTDAQRIRIRSVLTTTHSETTLTRKSTPAQTNFKPQIGGEIPNGFHPHGIPKPLITEIPVLKDYAYMKFNDQILIVDGTDKKIVEIVPER